MRVLSRPPAAWPCPRTKYADVERICGEHKAYELCTDEEYTEWTKDQHAGDNTPIMPRAHVLTTTPGDTSAQAQPNLAGT